MRFRHSDVGERKIELQMTPMIDIVFQLIVFFVMTFKIVAQEGDFNVKMPQADPSAGTIEEQDLPMRLELTANADGTISGIRFGVEGNEQGYSSFAELRASVINLLQTDAGPSEMGQQSELEIDADYQLEYVYVIEALTAVTGYRQGDDITPLFEKIRFTPPESE